MTHEEREKTIAEIREALEFNEEWWENVPEGEPICQDEIDAIKGLIKANRFLLSELERADKENRKLSEQLKEERAGHDEAVRLLNETRHENNSLKMMAKISNDFATEVKSLRQQLQSAKKEIERLREEREKLIEGLRKIANDDDAWLPMGRIARDILHEIEVTPDE